MKKISKTPNSTPSVRPYFFRLNMLVQRSMNMESITNTSIGMTNASSFIFEIQSSLGLHSLMVQTIDIGRQ